MRYVTRSFLFGCFILLTGCLSPVQHEALHEYDFENLVMIKKNIHQQHSNQILLLSVPRAMPAYASAKMVYVTDVNQIHYFATHQWAAPPAILLQSFMSQALQPYYRAVALAPFNGLCDIRLDLDLLYLRHEIHKAGSKTMIGIKATWVDTNTQRVMHQQSFYEERSSPIQGPDVFAEQTRLLLQQDLLPAMFLLTKNN